MFQNIRNQNIKLNYLTEIQKVLPKEAAELAQQPMAVIQQFVNTHNAKIMSDPSLAALQLQQGAIPHQQAGGQPGQPPMMMNPMMNP